MACQLCWKYFRVQHKPLNVIALLSWLAGSQHHSLVSRHLPEAFRQEATCECAVGEQANATRLTPAGQEQLRPPVNHAVRHLQAHGNNPWSITVTNRSRCHAKNHTLKPHDTCTVTNNNRPHCTRHSPTLHTSLTACHAKPGHLQASIRPHLTSTLPQNY